MSVKMDVQMTPRAMYDFFAVSHIQPSQWADRSDFWSCCTWTWNPGDGTGRLYRRYDVFLFLPQFFLVMTPLTLKSKAKAQVKTTPMFQKPITYELTEEGITIPRKISRQR